MKLSKTQWRVLRMLVDSGEIVGAHRFGGCRLRDGPIVRVDTVGALIRAGAAKVAGEYIVVPTDAGRAALADREDG